MVLGVIFRCLEPLPLVVAQSAESHERLGRLETDSHGWKTLHRRFSAHMSDQISSILTFEAVRKVRGRRYSKDQANRHAVHEYCRSRHLNPRGFRSIDQDVHRITFRLSSLGMITPLPAPTVPLPSFAVSTSRSLLSRTVATHRPHVLAPYRRCVHVAAHQLCSYSHPLPSSARSTAPARVPRHCQLRPLPSP